MAVAGILGQELLGVPVKWFEAGAAEYDLPVVAQVPILFLVMGFLETKRFVGFKETGSVSAGARHAARHRHTMQAHDARPRVPRATRTAAMQRDAPRHVYPPCTRPTL